MTLSFSERQLTSRVLFPLICLLCFTAFVVFIYVYQRHLLESETARVASHAKVISASLWSYEKQTPTDYLNLAVEANGYVEVLVRDEYHRPFIHLEGEALSGRENLLKSLKLIPVYRIESPISYEKRLIGHVFVNWPCRAVYLYFYIFFCILLGLNGIALYLKLFDAKRLLESRVRQRTADLELEVQERKRAEEELVFQAQRLSGHIRNTPLAVVEWSPDFKIVEWNKAAENIFGYSRHEVLGKRPFGLILPEELNERIESVWKELLSKEGGTRSVNVNLTKSGKEKTCSWYNTTLVDSDGTIIGVASLVLDITEQVEAERENRILQEQLMHAHKMEAVGNMAGGIAHDFNNILQSISGYTQLMLLDCVKRGEDCSRLKGVEKAAQRAADLVRQLLTFSRKIESNLKQLNLNPEIRHVRAMLDRTIPKMVAIEMILDPELLDIKADPVQVEQVLLNLAINSSHAMEDGGTLTIETANVQLDREFCSAHLGSQEGPNVLLKVVDTGTGMDEETVQRIFEPFFSTKETGKGTGLGLASVYGIVKSHHAYIQCSSSVGEGTEFSIYFPAISRQSSDFAEKRAEVITGGSERVLLVDDEENIREIGKEMLAKHGYRVLTASSGEEALELYREKGNGIDLVIMDLNMPGMGGFKCIRELKNVNNDCLVLVASGYTPTEFLQQASELGAAGFLSKPFQMTGFLRKIRETLDGRR